MPDRETFAGVERYVARAIAYTDANKSSKEIWGTYY